MIKDKRKGAAISAAPFGYDHFVALVGLDFFVPGVGLLEGVVDVVDVFYAGGVEPVFEGLWALLGVDGDAVLPGGAAAEDAVEAGAGFDG